VTAFRDACTSVDRMATKVGPMTRPKKPKTIKPPTDGLGRSGADDSLGNAAFRPRSRHQAPAPLMLTNARSPYAEDLSSSPGDPLSMHFLRNVQLPLTLAEGDRDGANSAGYTTVGQSDTSCKILPKIDLAQLPVVVMGCFSRGSLVSGGRPCLLARST
jgi:hypothetical protein